MFEDKNLIIEKLKLTLRSCDNCQDLVDMKYNEDDETVEVIFEEGKRVINVAMDSGTAMIRDVMNHLGV